MPGTDNLTLPPGVNPLFKCRPIGRAPGLAAQ